MTEQTTKQAIIEALAGKILKRLQKTEATEYKTLENAVRYIPKTTTTSTDDHTYTTGYTMIPKAVYLAALKHLASLKLIRKVKTSESDIVLVATTKATNKDLKQAIIRYKVNAKQSGLNFRVHLRNQKLVDLIYESDEPETHYSELGSFGNSAYQAPAPKPEDIEKVKFELRMRKHFTKSVCDKMDEVFPGIFVPESHDLTTHFDHDLAPALSNEFPTVPVQQDTIENRIDGSKVQLLITQQQTAQGYRNAARATQRRKEAEANNQTTYNFKTQLLNKELQSNIRRTNRLMEDQLAHTY